MFTACPHCNFLVTHAPRQPRPSTCPRCGQALPGATGGDPAAGGTPVAASSGVLPADDAPPLATLLAAPAGPRSPAVGASDAPAAIQSTAPVVTAAVAPAAAVGANAPAAAMANAGRHRAGLARWQWPLVAFLALLLSLQVLLADRARLAADARWRPLVERTCGLLGCRLPPWHQPSAFTMVERSVRPARSDGALQVEATFRNDAPWPQAWPVLQLSLADADGRTTGSGLFAPEQYLAGPPEGLLAPGQSAHVTFLVREPAADTVAFSFQFH